MLAQELQLHWQNTAKLTEGPPSQTYLAKAEAWVCLPSKSPPRVASLPADPSQTTASAVAEVWPHSAPGLAPEASRFPSHSSSYQFPKG